MDSTSIKTSFNRKQQDENIRILNNKLLDLIEKDNPKVRLETEICKDSKDYIGKLTLDFNGTSKSAWVIAWVIPTTTDDGKLNDSQIEGYLSQMKEVFRQKALNELKTMENPEVYTLCDWCFLMNTTNTVPFRTNNEYYLCSLQMQAVDEPLDGKDWFTMWLLSFDTYAIYQPLYEEVKRRIVAL